MAEMPAGDSDDDMWDLYDEIECDSRLDDMRRPGINFVPGNSPSGRIDCPVMLIGEFPSAQDNGQKSPFNGRVGRILGQLTDIAGIPSRDIYYTHMLKYRPANTLKSSLREQINFRSYLEREIEIVSPKVVITLGESLFSLVHPGGFSSRNLRSHIRGELAPLRAGKHRALIASMHDVYQGLRRNADRKVIEADWSLLWEMLGCVGGILCSKCNGEHAREGVECRRCAQE